MKSTKTNKGITLIALIITIVVLLILAAVAISSITNDGILRYAQNAADAYNQAQKNEAGILDGYLGYLDQQNQKMCPGHQWTGGGWGETGDIDEETGDYLEGYLETKCSICGLTCNHPGDWIESWEYWDEYECVVSYYCSSCGMLFDNDSGYYTDSHDYSGGTCIKCGNVCQHENLDEECQSTETECKIYYSCQDCDYWETTTQEEHGWEEGECNICGYVCDHNDLPYEINREPVDGYHMHEQYGYCKYCNYDSAWDIGECEDEDGDGLCDVCGFISNHIDDDSDGQCDVCGLCKEHIDEDGDETCDACNSYYYDATM